MAHLVTCQVKVVFAFIWYLLDSLKIIELVSQDSGCKSSRPNHYKLSVLSFYLTKLLGVLPFTLNKPKIPLPQLLNSKIPKI